MLERPNLVPSQPARHILFLGLDEAFEIVFRYATDIAGTQLNKLRISSVKINKMHTYAPEGAVVMANSVFSWGNSNKLRLITQDITLKSHF